MSIDAINAYTAATVQPKVERKKSKIKINKSLKAKVDLEHNFLKDKDSSKTLLKQESIERVELSDGHIDTEA